MSSIFDSNVASRRKHTPWTSVSFLSFVKEMCFNELKDEDEHEREVVFKATYRHDVASRFWYELEWTGADGERHSVSAQEFDLLMWRAAQREIDVERKLNDRDKNKQFVVSILGMRTDADPAFDDRMDAHMHAVKCSSATQAMEVWDKQTGDTRIIVRDGFSFIPQGVSL